MELRALGVRVSIDDFGSGHSSLATLGQLPLDALKMDRSFVRGIEVRADMGEIVAAVLVMARQLGLRVIAEGIENEARLAAVQSLGCDYGQGYLFARPMASEQVALVLHDGLSISSEGGLSAWQRSVPIQPRRWRRTVAAAANRRPTSWRRPPACWWLCWPGSVPSSSGGPPTSPNRRARTGSSAHVSPNDRRACARPIGCRCSCTKHSPARGTQRGTSRDRPGHVGRRPGDGDARPASASDGQLSRAIGGVASRGRVRAGRPRATSRRCVHLPSR